MTNPHTKYSNPHYDEKVEKIMKERKFKHYWMCDDCAEEMGGKYPEGHACTVTIGTCEYCKAPKQVLIPWVDFNWPNIKTAHLRD